MSKAINCKNDLVIEKPEFDGHHLKLSWVKFQETKQANDPVPNLRFYCHSWPNGYNLQIRATAPLSAEYGSKRVARNLIATINLDLEDLKQLRDYIDQKIKEALS